MATKTKKRLTPNKPKGADLARLTQQEAATLIGKPAVWMRDNAHLLSRNIDGTYDAANLVRSIQSQFRPAKLDDKELEPILHLCEDIVSFAVSSYGHPARLIEGIEQTHGAAGLAAIAQYLLETLREHLELFGDPEGVTAKQIQRKAEDEINRLEHCEASRQFRRAIVCELCGKYRWGRTWKSGPPPIGYATYDVTCPECDKPSRRRR